MENLFKIIRSLFGFGFVQSIGYAVLLAVFASKCCGASRVNDQFIDCMVFFGLVGMMIVQLIIGVNYLRKGNKITGAIGLILNFATIFLIYAFGLGSLENSNYYQDFSKQEWFENRPTKMSRAIIKKDLLKGLTTEEVTELLGESDDTSSKESMTYYTTEGFVLIIKTENNLVKNYNLFFYD